MTMLTTLLGALLLTSPTGTDVPVITDTLTESVVTGTRVSLSRDVLPVPVTVVGRTSLEQSDGNTIMPALMEEVPGLFVTSRGISGYGVSGGAAGGISLRGFGAAQGRVLVLIDGHPQYESIFGHPVADEYLGANAQRVEVSRGSASVLYGSNAMGGAINIITRRAEKEGNSLDFKMLGGSYGTFRASLSDSYRKGRLSASVSASYDRTDGHRANSAFDSKGAYARIGYDISRHWKTSFNISLMNAFSRNPGEVGEPMLDGTADVTRGMAGISFDNDYGASTGSVTFYYNWGDHLINDGHTAAEAPQEYLFKGTDYMGGLSAWQSFRPFEGNTLTGGLDLKLYGGNAYRDPVKEIYADNINLHEGAVYVFDQQELGRFHLNAGLRLESNETYGTELVPQAGLSFRAGRNTVLKASASKGFRTPNMRELYMYMSANAELLPERAWTFDLTATQTALDGRLRAEMSVFHIKGDNIIEVVRVEGNPQNRNVGEFANSGVEVSLAWTLNERFSLNGNYSYLHMSKPIVGSPEHKAYLGARYRTGKFSFSAGLVGIEGLYLATGDNPVKEGYVDLSARVSYTPVRGLSLFARGENLTNSKYQTMLGFPMPGATVYGGIEIRL